MIAPAARVHLLSLCLKEGWDNPDLPGWLSAPARKLTSTADRPWPAFAVGQNGHHDDGPEYQRLTLIVDEAFTEFRDGLNAEYVASGGSGELDDIDNADNEVIIRRRPTLFLAYPDLLNCGSNVTRRTTASQSIRTYSVYVVAASEHLADLGSLSVRPNVVQSADLVYDDEGRHSSRLCRGRIAW